MKKRLMLVRTLLVFLTSIFVMLSPACGVGSSEESISSKEPATAKVIVIDVQVSDDGDAVESITVETDEGRKISMRLSDDIDPSLWGPSHLLGHLQASEFGIQIGVTYVRTPDGVVATELSE